MTDEEVLAIVDQAFHPVKKPGHFTDFSHCAECAEHDLTLRENDRDTLRISDVGNIGWQPISFCHAHGIAYYLPTLSRFALAAPTYEYGWYGDMLLIHLTSGRCVQELSTYLNAEQKKAITELLQHFVRTRSDLEERLTSDAEMQAAVDLWSKESGTSTTLVRPGP
jgi:hypothetical protein